MLDGRLIRFCRLMIMKLLVGRIEKFLKALLTELLRWKNQFKVATVFGFISASLLLNLGFLLLKLEFSRLASLCCRFAFAIICSATPHTFHGPECLPLVLDRLLFLQFLFGAGGEI